MNVFKDKIFLTQTNCYQTVNWFKNDAIEVLGINIKDVTFEDNRNLKQDSNIVISPKLA